MTRARITVGGTPGSQDDWPINTLAQLDNDGNGGEFTYTWSLAYQPPPGTSDALSSLVIHNPTLTGRKEGTYRIRLVVNQGLGDEAADEIVLRIRQLKTRIGIPAVGEETQDSNWAEGPSPSSTENGPGVNEALRLLDRTASDPNIMVVSSGYSAAVGDVVAIQGDAVIKSGLPGQETIPLVAKVDSTDDTVMFLPLMLVVGPVKTGGPMTSGNLLYVRRAGLAGGIPVAGSPTPGSPVFVSSTGTLTAIPTNFVQAIALVTSGSGPYEVAWFGALRPPGFSKWGIFALKTDATLAQSSFANDLLAKAIGTAAGLTISGFPFQFRLRRTTLLLGGRIEVVSNTATTDVVVSVLKNGVSISDITVTLGGTGVFDFPTMPQLFNADDRWEISVVNTAGGAGNSIVGSYELRFQRVL